MSNTSSATASASVAFPFSTIAVVGLIIAKLQNLWGLGDLSWWWVFAPYWLPFLVFIAVLLIIGVIWAVGYGVVTLLDNAKSKKDAKKREELRKQLQDGTITAAEFRRRTRTRF